MVLLDVKLHFMHQINFLHFRWGADSSLKASNSMENFVGTDEIKRYDVHKKELGAGPWLLIMD